LVSCQGIADLMATDRLFAVFDVRERGEYNDCQIPGTTSLPRSQMEFRIGSLRPIAECLSLSMTRLTAGRRSR
jgi:rhodanese-related sulfurtransferase